MNINQLRYVAALAQHGLNMSETAAHLYTSQPGISQQIKLLEEELGVLLFERHGRQLRQITPAGKAIIELAQRALVEIDSVKQAAREFADPQRGELSIALTHTVARYAFPAVISCFRQQYPEVKIHLHLATPAQIAEQVNSGIVNFGIATEVMSHFEDLVALPCYRWRRAVLMPSDHPLAANPNLTIADLARYPLATYTFGFDRGAPLTLAFEQQGYTPTVSFTATDADVIKTYVRLGLGIGIVAALAYDPAVDKDLHVVDGSGLFETSTAHIVFRRGAFFRGFSFDFLTLFAPHLTESAIDKALGLKSTAAIDALFADSELPLF